MKKWFESSTVLINLVGLLAIGLDMALASNLIPDADVTAIIVSVLNIINRFRIKPNEKIEAIDKAVI